MKEYRGAVNIGWVPMGEQYERFVQMHILGPNRPISGERWTSAYCSTCAPKSIPAVSVGRPCETRSGLKRFTTWRVGRKMVSSSVSWSFDMPHLETIVPPLFKKTLSQWASGVTVITTLREGVPHGMTVSSFSSLSLEPPLVLVSVDLRARLHQLLPETGRYGVSILAKGQDALSTHFAGRPSHSLQIPWLEAEGLPFLDGALAHLACDVFDALPVGDHIIYVGRITHAQVWPDREPLLYYSGKYVTLSVA